MRLIVVVANPVASRVTYRISNPSIELKSSALGKVGAVEVIRDDIACADEHRNAGIRRAAQLERLLRARDETAFAVGQAGKRQLDLGGEASRDVRYRRIRSRSDQLAGSRGLVGEECGDDCPGHLEAGDCALRTATAESGRASRVDIDAEGHRLARIEVGEIDDQGRITAAG